MEDQNTGSFGAAIGGGGNALAQAMQSRGMDPNILNQISPAAPTAPVRGVPQPAPAGTASAVPQQATGPTPSKAESEIIVNALSSRLKRLGDLQEAGIQV